MKIVRKIRNQRTLSLSPDMKVADVLEQWPQTLSAFVKMGFAPLQNAFLRKTLAGKISIKQAADFRNVDVNILLANLQTAIANPTAHDEAFIDPACLRFDENTVPDLDGDVSVLGLVPCPIRNILVEKFDAYVQKNYAATGKKVAWWLAAEGTGLADIKQHITSIVKSKQYDSFPDYFLSVGTELLLHEDFCRILYEQSLFQKQPPIRNRRREFAPLEDPGGMLSLQFVALFSLNCATEAMDGVPLPRTWYDLAEPRYAGRIVIPALNLPIIPDLLAAVYFHLGDGRFIRFCRNVAFAQHPAQSSSRKARQHAPGIFITPLHFSRITAAPGQCHVIPEDGLVAVPAYVARRNRKNADAGIGSFLFSKDLLALYYANGTFIPNHAEIRVDYPLDRLITRPWSSLLENDPDLFLKQLLKNFKLDVTP